MPSWTEIRPWLNSSIQGLNITATEFARRANVEPSTVLRGLNSKYKIGSPNTTTIRKMISVSKVPFPIFPSTPKMYTKSKRTAPDKIELSDGIVVIEIRINGGGAKTSVRKE